MLFIILKNKMLFAFCSPANLHVLLVPSFTSFRKKNQTTWLMSWDATQFIYCKKKQKPNSNNDGV